MFDWMTNFQNNYWFGNRTEVNLYRVNNVTKILSVVGLILLAAVAGWQFYVFATFKDVNGAVDVQGGTLHLWFALGTAILVCVAGFFLFSKLLRYDKRNEMHITSAGQRRGPVGFRKDIL
jgi:hypothetical protein